MDSEAPATAILDTNSTTKNLPPNESTPMDTDEIINNPENSGEGSGKRERKSNKK